MKKLLSRFLVLAVLLGCLGSVSVLNSQARVIPPCPENCRTDCKDAYLACVAGCTDDPCITDCKDGLIACYAYCDWVCGPE
jgi:hypothetical protein